MQLTRFPAVQQQLLDALLCRCVQRRDFVRALVDALLSQQQNHQQQFSQISPQRSSQLAAATTVGFPFVESNLQPHFGVFTSAVELIEALFAAVAHEEANVTLEHVRAVPSQYVALLLKLQTEFLCFTDDAAQVNGWVGGWVRRLDGGWSSRRAGGNVIVSLRN
jgi:hypothetical protein